MLSRTAQHALRALVYLARQHEDNYHQTQNVAESLQIPSNYLGKILQKLARRHIVDSQKGLLGGFRMARPADQITLYEILSTIDALPPEGQRSSDNDNIELVNLEQRFATINNLYIKFLKETTLATVMTADQIASDEHEFSTKEEADASAVTI